MASADHDVLPVLRGRRRGAPVAARGIELHEGHGEGNRAATGERHRGQNAPDGSIATLSGNWLVGSYAATPFTGPRGDRSQRSEGWGLPVPRQEDPPAPSKLRQ